MKVRIIIIVFLDVLAMACNAQGNSTFRPCEVWLDDAGNVINAHGGGLLYHNGTYYWYGEYKQGETVLPEWATWECYRTDVTGVSCYSSKDLLNWHFEGLVLNAEKTDSLHDLHTSKVVERPKVIYNAKTRKFVMWMHIDSADYSKASAGVAVSDSPVGPFTYLGSFRPNGEMSRDQTLFVDDDGKAFQICSAEDNATMYVHLLTDDYLKPTKTFTRNFEKKYREAPAVFKHQGKYYLLTSGCSGWDPNVADVAVADSMLGEWKTLGNPCVGKDADKTFYGQSTYVLPVIGHPGLFIALFDRWKKTDLPDSRYICQNPSRACFLCFDPCVYVILHSGLQRHTLKERTDPVCNFDPVTWAGKSEVKTPVATTKHQPAASQPLHPMEELAKARAVTRELLRRGANIADDYGDYLKLGFALANGLGNEGRELYHELCSQSTKYRETDCERKWQQCMRQNDGRTTIATFYNMAKQAGVDLSSIAREFKPESIYNY